jgi:hypothetical protein
MSNERIDKTVLQRRTWCHSSERYAWTLQQRPVKGTTSSVNSVSTENKTLKMTKLEGFSSFHNFQHEDKGIRIWKAFSVGSGRFIPHSNIFLQHQGPTNLKVEEDQDFFQKSVAEASRSSKTRFLTRKFKFMSAQNPDVAKSSTQWKTYACILKAHSHSHSTSGGSIWASLECECRF